MTTLTKNFILSFVILIQTPFYFTQTSLDFDGIDDRIDCGNNPSIQITGYEMTMEAWIYPTYWKANPYEGCVINKESSSGGDNGYMLRVGDNGRINFNIGSSGWNELTTDMNTLQLNVWQHIAATYDGSNMTIYKDGIAVISSNFSGAIGNSVNNLIIGDWATQTWGTRNFPGKIDEVKIWNIAKSQNEIQNGMNAEFCSLPNNLVAYYNFEEGIADGTNTGLSTLIDQTTNGNNGTLSGFLLSSSSSNWTQGVGLTPQIDTSLSFGDPYGTTIISNQSGASYQWIDCSNFTNIAGATDSSYTPASNGSYAVIITLDSCIVTSNCTEINTVNIIENQNLTSFHPNPTKGSLFISLEKKSIQELTIFDITGKRILTIKGNNKSTMNVDLDIPNGIYIVDIRGGNNFHDNIKIIKK
jgi:hypothetical protein